MRMRSLLLTFLFPLVASAQWVNKGPLPSPPSSTQPFRRAWTKPVFDTVHSQLLFYFAQPNCCSGTFSNALFGYNAAQNSWSLLWTHGTTQQAGGPPDSMSAPADRHPYHVMAWDVNRGLFYTGFGSAQVGGLTGNCGDCGISDLYSYSPSGNAWTEICGFTVVACPVNTKQTQEAAAAYDPVNDVLAMYGGLVGGSPVADLWFYYPALNTWREVCGQEVGIAPRCPSPALHQHTMVSLGNGKIFLFGGLDGHGAEQNGTWIVDAALGSMTPVTVAVTPPAQRFPVADYVARLNAVILIDPQAPAHVWAFDATAYQWVDLNIPPGPTLRTTYSANQGGYDPSADRFDLFIDSGGNTTSYVWQLQLPLTLVKVKGSVVYDDGSPAIGGFSVLNSTGKVIKSALLDSAGNWSGGLLLDPTQSYSGQLSITVDGAGVPYVWQFNELNLGTALNKSAFSILPTGTIKIVISKSMLAIKSVNFIPLTS